MAFAVADFRVHPRLLEDGHALGRLPLCHVLLNRNASLPWLVLVPEVDAGTVELHELDAAARRQLWRETDAVARFLKGELGAAKLNIAAIGNVVPQLHVHVVGRAPGDPCWPGVVWGRLPAGPAWPEEQLDWFGRAISGLAPGLGGAP